MGCELLLRFFFGLLSAIIIVSIRNPNLADRQTLILEVFPNMKYPTWQLFLWYLVDLVSRKIKLGSWRMGRNLWQKKRMDRNEICNRIPVRNKRPTPVDFDCHVFFLSLIKNINTIDSYREPNLFFWLTTENHIHGNLYSRFQSFFLYSITSQMKTSFKVQTACNLYVELFKDLITLKPIHL